MSEEADSDVRRPQSDRVYFNLLVILTGVVLGFAAMVLLELIRQGPPWRNLTMLGMYLGWLASVMLVTVTFVSQALGSAQMTIHPTTGLIVWTFALSIAEFVSFGLLEPRQGVQTTPIVRNWLACMGVANLAAAGFVTLVLHQAKYPGKLHDKAYDDVRGDRLAAAAIGLVCLGMSAALHRDNLMRRWSWVTALAVDLLLTAGLAKQQQKTRWASPISAAGKSPGSGGMDT